MTADTRTPAKRESALQAWKPQALTVLEAFPTDKYNVLVPTESVRQVNPYLVPDIEVVRLSVDESKGDIYHDNQMKSGHYAPTAKGLAKIRQVAGIDEIDSRRTDDGKDPEVVEWTVVIEMALPSGQRVRAHGSKRMDMNAMSFASDSHRRKARQFLLEHAQTKALNRAIRSMLTLHGSMPKVEIAKPFAILRWVPNMSDPDVRRRMLDNLLPASVAAYGPEPRQLVAGEEVIEAPEVPDDDATEGEFVERPSNGGTHSVDARTGEVVATSEPDEPDWFGDEAQAQQVPSLASRLTQVAEANGSATGPATNEQRQAIKEVLHGLKNAEAGAVLADLFSIDDLSAIEQRHATAILEVGAALGHERLVEEWRSLTAELEAAGSA